MDEKPGKPFHFDEIEDDRHPLLLRLLVGPILGFAGGAMAGLAFGLFQFALPWMMLPEPGLALVLTVAFGSVMGAIAGGILGLFVNVCIWILGSFSRKEEWPDA